MHAPAHAHAQAYAPTPTPTPITARSTAIDTATDAATCIKTYEIFPPCPFLWHNRLLIPPPPPSCTDATLTRLHDIYTIPIRWIAVWWLFCPSKGERKGGNTADARPRNPSVGSVSFETECDSGICGGSGGNIFYKACSGPCSTDNVTAGRNPP